MIIKLCKANPPNTIYWLQRILGIHGKSLKLKYSDWNMLVFSAPFSGFARFINAMHSLPSSSAWAQSREMTSSKIGNLIQLRVGWWLVWSPCIMQRVIDQGVILLYLIISAQCFNFKMKCKRSVSLSTPILDQRYWWFQSRAIASLWWLVD